MFDLADPWLLLLLGLPALIHALPARRLPARAALRVPEGVGRHIASGLAIGARRDWARLALPMAIWTLMVVALAGPRQVMPNLALPMSGRDLILALDLSGSMVRDDFTLDGKPATRLDALRRVGADFVRGRAGDRVGLVVFGSEAYVAAPPTFDVDAVADTVEGMVIGISGRATNISDAIGIALKRLDGSDAETRVVIVLSDGANNAGAATPRDVAALAGQMGVRIHTIAMGPKDTETAPAERGVVDAVTLQAVSDLSGGQMFRVRTTDDLRAVTEDIDRLEPTARAGLAAETYRQLWIWPALLAGLGCLWLGWRARG